MAKFLKIRYNANGFLKNRIINADDISVIEPFSGPAGRYVDETRSRIFMKDGTKYDMSNSVDDIQKILDGAGALIAEIHSTQPVRQKVAPAMPTMPVNLYKRSVLVKQGEAPVVAAPAAPTAAVVAKPVAVKPVSAPAPVAAKPAAPKSVAPKPAMPVAVKPAAFTPLETARMRAEDALAKTIEMARKPIDRIERVLIKHPAAEAPRKQADGARGRA